MIFMYAMPWWIHFLKSWDLVLTEWLKWQTATSWNNGRTGWFGWGYPEGTDLA